MEIMLAISVCTNHTNLKTYTLRSKNVNFSLDKRKEI